MLISSQCTMSDYLQNKYKMIKVSANLGDDEMVDRSLLE